MLLMLREELICLLILIFILGYYVMNKVNDKNNVFLRLLCYALTHVLFDMITFITVNSRDVVPSALNWLLHNLFFVSGILFIYESYNYILEQAGVYIQKRNLRYAGYIPLLIYAVCTLFLPIEYVEGNGTSYSFGPLVFVAYGLFILYGLINIVLLFLYHHRMEPRVRRVLIPMILLLFAEILAQALIPELLMTGAAITFVCIGIFVTLDHPDRHFRQQALWDFLTHLKNRNSYGKDLEQYKCKYANAKKEYRIGFVMADINGLKYVNDNFGHMEGDKLIVAASDVLKASLKSAEGIYRIGGDEFAAIYFLPEDEKVLHEMEQVKKMCSEIEIAGLPLGIALGYSAGRIVDTVQEICEKADQKMYEDKARMKGRRIGERRS